MKTLITIILTAFVISFPFFANAQQGIGINTTGTVADPQALLDVKSTTKGFLLPRLTFAQRNLLGTSLTTTQTGMEVSDSSTGELYFWTGSQWSNTARLTAKLPVKLNTSTNTFSLNAGTQAGDLLSWDGNNWISLQPPSKFTDVLNNMQPYETINYIISAGGVFPSQNDAQPFVGQIMMVGFNFAPRDFFECDGQLLPITAYNSLYFLIGTTYGGDGVNTFGLPDLRGRAALDFGQGTGLPTYFLGETSGVEQQVISH